MHEDQNAPMAPHSGDGVSGFAWADDGLGYSLVGSSASDALKLIADEARKQTRSAI
jgi:anti-sigma factor RsiW